MGEDFSDLRDNPTQYAGGVGFRYMMDPKSKLTIGADLAYGSEGITFYVHVGDFFAN